MSYIFNEYWSQIPGFPDYLISDHGHILSYKRGDWRYLNPYLGKNGYLYVNLRANNITIRRYIHRLVAETFIPNSENKPVVNHIDGDKTNNFVSNLEWCTDKENSKHAYALGLSRLPDPEIYLRTHRTPVKLTNLDTGETFIFESQAEAADTLGIDRSHLNMALKKRCSHAKRYAVEYLNEEGYNDD